MKTSEILKNLENGKIDIAIITTEKNVNKNLNIVYSEDIQDIFIANKEYKEKINSPIKLEDLNKYPLLLQSQNSNIQVYLDKFLSKNNIELNSFMELASYSLAIDFAKIGFGISFITRNYVKEELKSKQLYEIKTIPALPKRKILVLTKKDYLPSFSVQKLIEIIKENKELK